MQKPSVSFNFKSATLEGDALRMPSLLYLQTLCSVTYAEHEGNPLISGLGVTAQSAVPGQERRIAHLPPPCQAVAAG